MENNPIATVIIAFYKRLDFLGKILEGLKNQSLQGFEVIVAEDDDSPSTVEFVAKTQPGLPFQIKLVSQEDMGFRKNKILNAALMAAASENIIFLDGDCIPHKHFVKQYCNNISTGNAFFGRRVMLGGNFSLKLLINHGIRCLNIFSLLFSDTKRIEEGLYFPWFKKEGKSYRGVWGCNWGIKKQDIVLVNGFDEDYVNASVGEDNDIEWRLRLNGVRFNSLKHKAIVYHIHHKENYCNEDFRINNALFEDKKKLHKIFCTNGLAKDNR